MASQGVVQVASKEPGQVLREAVPRHLSVSIVPLVRGHQLWEPQPQHSALTAQPERGPQCVVFHPRRNAVAAIQELGQRYQVLQCRHNVKTA